MTGITLRNYMNAAIMSLPNPDRELPVTDVKTLDEIWKLLSFEAKGDSCSHPPEHMTRIAAGDFCHNCGRLVGP